VTEAQLQDFESALSSVETDLQQQQLNLETLRAQTSPLVSLTSIQYSQSIIGKSAASSYNLLTVGPADLSGLVSKAVIESTQIQIKSIRYGTESGKKAIGLAMTLGDGTTVSAGRTVTSTAQLPENLYKIETIITNDEYDIYQIKFYGSSGVVTIGNNNSLGPGRVETFNLAAGEELIAWKLYWDNTWTVSRGIEWIKWSPPA
jgi:hypothetical protein